MTVTYETQAFLLDVGIDYWLAGFQTVGEAIEYCADEPSQE